MKRFLRAIALPLGISIILPVATGMLWPLVLFKTLGVQGVLENRERLASVWRVVSRSEVIATVGMVVWAGWRARSRLRTGIGTAALAGAVVTVVDRLINTAALFAVRGRSIGAVVFAFLGGGLLGAVLGTIGGLLVARFHPAPRASVLRMARRVGSASAAKVASRRAAGCLTIRLSTKRVGEPSQDGWQP